MLSLQWFKSALSIILPFRLSVMRSTPVNLKPTSAGAIQTSVYILTTTTWTLVGPVLKLLGLCSAMMSCWSLTAKYNHFSMSVNHVLLSELSLLKHF